MVDALIAALLLAPLATALAVAWTGIPLESPIRELVIFLLGAMESLGVALAAQLVVAHRNRPRLVILAYLRDASGNIQLFSTSLSVPPYTKADVARIYVTNEGNSPAENCRARLTIIDPRVGGDKELYLCWTELGGVQTLTVYRDEKVRLDLYGQPTASYTSGGRPANDVIFPCAESWQAYVPVPRPANPPTIKVRVQIFARNAEPSPPREFDV